MPVETATPSSDSQEFKPASPVSKVDIVNNSTTASPIDSIVRMESSASPRKSAGRPPSPEPRKMDVRHPRKPHQPRDVALETRHKKPAKQQAEVPVIAEKPSLPPSPLEGIGDIVTVDSKERGHDTKGRYISDQNMDVIEANADFIRQNPPPPKNLETPANSTIRPAEDGTPKAQEAGYRPVVESDLSDMPSVLANEPYIMDTGTDEAQAAEPRIETTTEESESPSATTPSADEGIGYRPVVESDLPDMPSVTANEPYIMDTGEGERPTEEPSEQQPISLVAMDTRETDLKAARLLADEQLDAELREIRERLFETDYRGTNRFSRIVRSVAKAVRSTFVHPIDSFKYFSKSTFLREGHRQAYIQKHFGDMSGPMFHETVAAEVARRIDLGEDLLLEGEQILRQDTPEVAEVKTRLNEVFQRGVTEGMSKEDVLEEAKRVLASASWIEQGSDQQVHMLQNLDVIYDRIITAVDHEAGLASIDAAYELVGGKVTLGTESEAHVTTTDRILEKLTNSKLKGALVNEATMAIAIGGAVSLFGYFARSKGARVVAGALVGGPVGILVTAGSAGLFAAARERMTLRQERAMEMSRVASGGAIGGAEAETGPRRAEIDATLYDMVSASEVTGQLRELIPEDITSMDADGARALFATLTALRTNMALGDTNRVDLIRYSSEDLIEQEKTDLLVLRAQSERALAQYMTEHPEFMADLPGATIQEKLNFAQGLQSRDIATQMSAKDRSFQSLTRKRATQRAVATFAFAAAGSYVSRQIVEHFRGEPTAPSTAKPEILENHKQLLTMRGDSLDLPKGWKLEGTSLIDARGNHITDTFQYNPDGTLSKDTILAMQGRGIKFHETMTTQTITTTREVPVDEYANIHPERLTTVHREGWMGNNTPMWQDASGKWHGADLNELGGRFGSDGQGNVLLGTSPMTDTGSFQGAIHIAAHAQQTSGNLKWILTPDKNNPSRSFLVDINPDGTVALPKGSDMHSMFDIDPSGRVTLHSGYAEVAVPTGRVGANGGQGFYILATQVGNNAPRNIPTIDTGQIIAHHGTLMVPEAPKPGADAFVPFIPIASPLPRKPLERLVPADAEPYLASPYLVGYNGSEMSPEDEARARARFSPRLRDNPDVVLDPREEIEDYLAREGTTRVTELEQLAGQIEPMSEQCKTAVLIPVNGAQEGDNIYNTLKWYSGQVDSEGNPIDPSSYEIVLFVNKPTDMEWDETLTEIGRFQADNPGVTIRVVQKEYSRAEAKIGRIRKDLADLVLLRQSQRISSGDVVLISNDADCKGLGQSYIDTITTQMGAQAADGLAGRLEWDPSTTVESPLYHMGVKVMQVLDLIDRHPSPGSGRKARYRYPGANFAFSASMYAAIGGYDPTDVKAEDVVLGRKIKLARKGSTLFDGVEFYGGDNVVYTDSRRGIAAFAQGYPPASQWSKLSFGPSDEVREGAELEDTINYDLLLDEEPSGVKAILQRRVRAKFEGQFKDFIEQTVREYALIARGTQYHEGMRMPGDLEIVVRALKALRIDADVDVVDGQFAINFIDLSRMYEYLRRYQNAGPRAYAARTGLERIFPGGFAEVFPETRAA